VSPFRVGSIACGALALAQTKRPPGDSAAGLLLRARVSAPSFVSGPQHCHLDESPKAMVAARLANG